MFVALAKVIRFFERSKKFRRRKRYKNIMLGIFDRKLGFFDRKLGIFDQVGNLRPISWVFPTVSWESSSDKLCFFVL